MTQQNSATGSYLPDLVTMDPHVLFDSIMEKIEPDLTTKNVKLLSEKYKDETEVEKEERFTRYTKAFGLYNERKKECFAKMDTEASQYLKNRLKAIEKSSREKEDEHLLELEKIFQ